MTLDVRLAKFATDGKAEVDMSAPLSELRLPSVANSPNRKAAPPKSVSEPAPPGKKEGDVAAAPLTAWEVGSKWVTKNRAGGETTWTVRSRDGEELEIQRPSIAEGTVVVSLKIKGNRVTVTRVRHDDGNKCMDRDWNGSGTIGLKSLSLKYSVNSNGGKGWERWDESINLKPD